MKNDKIEIKEKELENVTGGDVTSANIVGTVRPHCRPTAESLVSNSESKVPTVDPVELKPDKSDKDALVPIPY